MLDALLAGQNPDGGWGARPGGVSWTEPTAWALLALYPAEGAAPAVAKGLDWLRRARLPAGGWPASPAVSEACWVSAVIALLPRELAGPELHEAAVAHVEQSVERPFPLAERIRRWMLGIAAPSGPPAFGWSWVPGTAAWLTPTALSILALRKDGPGGPERARILAEAGNYLRVRQCADGGWNHGASRALGYESDSYPETTGLGLLALRGESDTAVKQAIAAAERHAVRCQTYEGACWLRIALAAHGKTPRFEPPPDSKPDLRELALCLIGERVVNGESLLWRAE